MVHDSPLAEILFDFKMSDDTGAQILRFAFGEDAKIAETYSSAGSGYRWLGEDIIQYEVHDSSALAIVRSRGRSKLSFERSAVGELAAPGVEHTYSSAIREFSWHTHIVIYGNYGNPIDYQAVRWLLGAAAFAEFADPERPMSHRDSTAVVRSLSAFGDLSWNPLVDGTADAFYFMWDAINDFPWLERKMFEHLKRELALDELS